MGFKVVLEETYRTTNNEYEDFKLGGENVPGHPEGRTFHLPGRVRRSKQDTEFTCWVQRQGWPRPFVLSGPAGCWGGGSRSSPHRLSGRTSAAQIVRGHVVFGAPAEAVHPSSRGKTLGEHEFVVRHGHTLRAQGALHAALPRVCR